MPVTLTNGEVIYNVTQHHLDIYDEEADRNYVVHSDGVVNARPTYQVIKQSSTFELVRMLYQPTEEGRALIERIKRECPKALIVGSVIAAQAYPGEVVAPVPYRYRRKQLNGAYKPMRSNRFSTFG